MLLAKALYDNVAESPEELAMRRGDILTVLEQDTSGLEGWWLCSLKGRRGIVPGNRLRVLDKALGQREMALVNANLWCTDRAGTQKEWHNPNKVVIPQRLGNMFVYDVPKRVAPSSGHYDIPPSAGPQPAPRSVIADYDHPPSNRPVMSKVNANLDPVQHLQTQMVNQDHYDVPGSNRSSTVSMMSMGSNVSAVSSGSGQHSSLCESERSSLDLSGQDMYDVPPPARVVPTPAARRLPPGSSVDSSTYDTPKSQKYSHKHSKSLDLLDEACDSAPCDTGSAIADNSELMSTYSVPKPVKPVSRNCSADSGISLAVKNQIDLHSMHTYDAPIPQPYDTPARCKTIGDSLDYDTPKSCGTVLKGSSKDGGSAEISVYDVPPRVTKDTGSSLQQPMADDVKRASSGSSDSDAGTFPYDELRMELTAAMESIVSLQHNINSSCSKLLAFVHPSWRHPDNLEPKIYQIKLSALAVKTAGDEFTQFAQGALANAAKADDKRLTKKLSSAIEILSSSLKTFTECLQKLNKDMWPLVKLVRDERRASEGDDELDIIVRITRDIPECVRRISGLIQGNSLVLFRRGDSSGVGAALMTSTPKPKARLPPPVKPKPRLSVGNGNGNGNGAPLAKFVSKSVDSTPTTEEAPQVQISPQVQTLPTKLKCELDDPDKSKHNSLDQVDYDVPKSSLTKPGTDNIDSSIQRGLPDGATTVDEYDYVSLTKDPSLAKRVMSDEHLVEIDNQKDEIPVYAQVKKDSSHGRQVKSLFPPEEISPSDPSTKLEDCLEKLQQEAEEPVKIHTEDYDVPHSRPVESMPNRSPSLTVQQILPNDRQILSFYATQMETHSAILMNAIEAFIKCIDEQQPPKMFIAYSKYVILAAHKLVYIGDTLTRHLMHENIRNDIMNHAYTLCELLKGTVTATKKAALEFPAVQAVQEMVDKVSEVSVAASRFRTLLSQFAS